MAVIRRGLKSARELIKNIIKLLLSPEQTAEPMKVPVRNSDYK